MDTPAGGNLARLKSKLRRHPAAMTALRAMGLEETTIDALHLGLREPYRARRTGLETSDALCFPILAEDHRPTGRYANIALEGVTVNPQHAEGWGAGPSVVYRLGSRARCVTAVVFAHVADAWLGWQLAGDRRDDVAIISRSHVGGWPSEWLAPSFWADFVEVVLAPGVGADEFLRRIAPAIGRPISTMRLPTGCSDIRTLARSELAVGIGDLLQDVARWDDEVAALGRDRVASAAVPGDAGSGEPGLVDAMDDPTVADVDVAPDRLGPALGHFAAAPAPVVGAFAGGRLHYPFLVESRTLRGNGRPDDVVVQAYRTLVVRSDGRLLTTELLPAPPGTPPDRRVLSLSDGTRIVAQPTASMSGTWSYGSIQRFVGWRLHGGDPPFASLPDLLSRVEAHMRSRVWLPDGRTHVLGVAYVAASHCFQLFDALPLLLVLGPRGTGKSEYGEAAARLSFNATIAGQLRAAGMIRLLDETRGMLVLDDMDGEGRCSVVGNGELAQALKTSYKRSTSLKPVADRGGRVRMIDFFGPKILSRTRPVDAVLGSRVIVVGTGSMPHGETLAPPLAERELDELRNELHCWAMASATDLRDAYAAVTAVRSDRRAEIEAPMRAIAALAGGDWPGRIDEALGLASTRNRHASHG